MFNIKNIVNRITDRGRESNPNSPERATQEDEEFSNQRAEGFLCPKCMKAFSSPTELQAHYETLHAEDSSADVHGATGPGFFSLHQEVGERYKSVQDGSSHSTGSGFPSSAEEVSSITDVSELQKMLAEMMDSRAALQTEKDHLEQRAAQLAQLNVTLKAACDEGESSQIALKERLKVVEAQLAHRESIDDAAVLRQELVQVQRVMDELNREREQERDALRAELLLLKSDGSQETVAGMKGLLEQKVLEISQLTSALEASQKQLLELCANQEDENLKANDEVEALRNQLASTKEIHDKEVAMLKNECDQLTKERDSIKDRLNDLEQKTELDKAASLHEVEELRLRMQDLSLSTEEKDSALSNAQEETKLVCMERDDLKTEVFQKSQQIEELKRIRSSCEEKIGELNNTLMKSAEKILKMENERSELVAQIEVGEGATTAIQQLTEENNSLQVKLKEEIERHSKNREESLRSLQDVTKQLGECEKLKQTLELKLKNEQSHVGNLQAKFDTMVEKNKGLQEKLSQKDVAMEEMRISNSKTKSDLAELKKKLSESEESFSEKSTELYLLTTKFEALLQKGEKLRKDIAELNGEKLLLSNRTKELSESVQELNDQLNKAKTSNNDLQLTVSKLTDTVKTKEEEFSSLKAEMDAQVEENSTVMEKLKSTEEQLQIIGVQRASLETNLFEVQKNIAELESEKKDLEEEKAKEISALREMVREKTECLEKREEAVRVLMGERVTLTQQIETMQHTHLKELKEMKSKCEKLLTELAACNQSKEEVDRNLSDELESKAKLEEDVRKMTAKLESAVKEYTDKEKTLQASLDEVSGEKLALEVQLEASQAERQALLERCYASASETENLHRTIADLRRKLDESQAALHELGRENQTLQLDIDKLIGRKWAEDSEVTQCTLCHRDFSIRIRKHHCRNCGQIFCAECSSKTAPIASNKKPVRVCDSCYGELTPK